MKPLNFTDVWCVIFFVTLILFSLAPLCGAWLLIPSFTLATCITFQKIIRNQDDNLLNDKTYKKRLRKSDRETWTQMKRKKMSVLEFHFSVFIEICSFFYYILDTMSIKHNLLLYGCAIPIFKVSFFLEKWTDFCMNSENVTFYSLVCFQFQNRFVECEGYIAMRFFFEHFRKY